MITFQYHLTALHRSLTEEFDEQIDQCLLLTHVHLNELILNVCLRKNMNFENYELIYGFLL